MKTQIDSLINGEKCVIRDESHLKYLTAKKSSSHNGYAGTNLKERLAIANKVIAENPDNLIIEIKGKRYTLDKYVSCSGKSVIFVGNITEDDFAHITGNKPLFEYESFFNIRINNDMTVCIDIFTRKHENIPFKQRGTVNIDEAFIIII